MLDQDDVQASNASTRTRQTSGILTPASDTSLNFDDGAGSGERKRKRDGKTMEDLLKDSFIVRPYPSTAFSKPHALQPLILLPRSQLPLSSLDVGSTTNPLPQTRHFETHVKILELEERMGSQPMVLIARLDDGRTLFAVEREDPGLYVLCQLGSWVKLEGLRAAAIVSKQEPRIGLQRRSGSSRESQEEPAVPLITPAMSKDSKKKRLAIEAIQCMMKRSSTANLKESPNVETEPQPVPELQVEQVAGENVQEDASLQPTASEIFDNVRNQYFETLYLSKASLAYFPKGPLSRARAAFHLDYDSTLDMNGYIAFLESLIITPTLIDKKYRDAVPACISSVDIHDQSADDVNQVSFRPKKKKMSKKMKPGKNGLYPHEDSLIGRWWTSHDDEAESQDPATTREDITKGRISRLRIRETQLQIVVILEVLALRPLGSGADVQEEDLPVALPNTAIGSEKDRPLKSRRHDELTTLIDVHIDRLSIWQSIALESVETTIHPPTSMERVDGSNTVNNRTDNILRDFCVDVIAPFFSARLPERCASINRKLGGPVIISPPKPRLARSASTSSSHTRPGAATKRPVPANPRQTLQRVLTDDRDRRSMSRGPNGAISLTRSTTAPAVSGLKREASEAPSLSTVPVAESKSLQASRGGFLKSKNFSRREVDMSALALDATAKVKMQASIEAELKDAISALKRPNRELAGKSLVETAEKRSASASHSRKSKKPVRNPLFQGVQISATPKINRHRTISTPSQKRKSAAPPEEVEMAVIPPSSLPRVPQSAIKDLGENQTSKALFAPLQATPIRRHAPGHTQQQSKLLSVPVDYRECLGSSPLPPHRSSALAFPLVPDSAVKGPSTIPGLFETPVRKKTVFIIDHDQARGLASSSEKENAIEEELLDHSFATRGEMKPQQSIYKALGWDDGDDFDDLA